jgi:hypothetical protein
VLAGTAAVAGIMATARRSLRPRYPHGDDRRIAFTMVRIEEAGVAAMTRAARAWGVTRADLMIALLMRAIAPLAGAERIGKRRREIGIATIINIRRDVPAPVKESFGQFLSSYRYAHLVPDGITLEELARDVHRETSRVRRRKLPAKQPRWPASTGCGQAHGFAARNNDAKNYPAWAGPHAARRRRVMADAGAASPPMTTCERYHRPASPRRRRHLSRWRVECGFVLQNCRVYPCRHR